MPSVVRRPVARPAAVAAALGALVLAGCSGGGDAGPAEVVSPSPVDLAPTARVELARGIYEENDPGGDEKPLVSSGASVCIADRLVEEIGVADLVGLGVLTTKAAYRGAPRSIPEAEAGKWIGAFEECLDLDDYVLGVARAGVRVEAPAFGERDTAWADARTCLDKAPGASRAVMLGQLTAQPRKDAPTTAFVDCVKVAYPQARL